VADVFCGDDVGRGYKQLRVRPECASLGFSHRKRIQSIVRVVIPFSPPAFKASLQTSVFQVDKPHVWSESMSFLRNTDVKKHLARVVPRSVSPDTENSNQPNGDTVTVPSIYQAETVPVPVTTDVPPKVETV
jgi:hypothetical protein